MAQWFILKDDSAGADTITPQLAALHTATSSKYSGIVDLPLISGPVALLESGRFQGIAIWPSQARLRLAQAVCSSANCAA
jgi:hypothetical protein